MNSCKRGPRGRTRPGLSGWIGARKSGSGRRSSARIQHEDAGRTSGQGKSRTMHEAPFHPDFALRERRAECTGCGIRATALHQRCPTCAPVRFLRPTLG
jgi:hypothetical protein